MSKITWSVTQNVFGSNGYLADYHTSKGPIRFEREEHLTTYIDLLDFTIWTNPDEKQLPYLLFSDSVNTWS